MSSLTDSLFNTDINLIPTDDLPLQAILPFQPCSSDVAAAYLQDRCLAEGHHIEPQSLLQLYESTDDLCSVDMPDDPIHPLSEGLPLSDLRKCINRLQLHFCVPDQLLGPIVQSPVTLEDIADWSSDEVVNHASETQSCSRDGQENVLPIHHLQAHSDIVSFADCYLVRSPLETPEVSGTNRWIHMHLIPDFRDSL
jgi:hypothetical protein